MSFYVYTSTNDYYRSPYKSVKLVGIFEDEEDAWDACYIESRDHWDDDFSDSWVALKPYDSTQDDSLWGSVDNVVSKYIEKEDV